MRHSHHGFCLRVVIVSGDHQGRLLVTRWLRASMPDVEFVETADVAVAVDLARNQRPDVILIESDVAKLDEWRALRQIRRLEGGEYITLIAVTAEERRGDSTAALASGCDDYLVKPIVPVIVERKIRKWLQSRRCLLEGLESHAVLPPAKATGS